jgi:hypothetical protein
MATIATLMSDLGMLQKLLGVLIKGGLPGGYLQRLIDEAEERQAFIAWVNDRSESKVNDSSPPKLWERVSDTAIRVFSQCPVTLPFNGAKPELLVESDLPESWLVELRSDGGLYVESGRVELFLAEQQRTGFIHGNSLEKQLVNQSVLHPNILDALYENIHLIPDGWKKDERGCKRFIFFWAVRFRDSGGDLPVRYLSWNNGLWHRHCGWFDDGWGNWNPAAVLVS